MDSVDGSIIINVSSVMLPTVSHSTHQNNNNGFSMDNMATLNPYNLLNYNVFGKWQTILICFSHCEKYCLRKIPVKQTQIGSEFFYQFVSSSVAFERILYPAKAIEFELLSIFRFKNDNNYFSNEIIQMYEQREWYVMRYKFCYTTPNVRGVHVVKTVLPSSILQQSWK